MAPCAVSVSVVFVSHGMDLERRDDNRVKGNVHTDRDDNRVKVDVHTDRDDNRVRWMHIDRDDNRVKVDVHSVLWLRCCKQMPAVARVRDKCE